MNTFEQELEANGGHTAECEQFCSPDCPIGQEKRREAKHRAALVQYAWSRGIAVAVLDRQRVACERGDGSCNHQSISECVELARVYNVAR